MDLERVVSPEEISIARNNLPPELLQYKFDTTPQGEAIIAALGFYTGTLEWKKGNHAGKFVHRNPNVEYIEGKRYKVSFNFLKLQDRDYDAVYVVNTDNLSAKCIQPFESGLYNINFSS